VGRSNVDAKNELRTFLICDPAEHFAFEAVFDLNGKHPLRFSVTERTGNCPANAAAVDSSVQTVAGLVDRRRANSLVAHIEPTRFPAALLNLPAVRYLFHFDVPYSLLKTPFSMSAHWANN
jgi:hypothetical protein